MASKIVAEETTYHRHLEAILLPVFAQAREKARQANCASNLRQIGLAFMMYAQDYDETYPPTDYNTPVVGRVTWPTLVEPYIKAGVQKPVGQLEPKNQRKSVFVCPSVDANPPDPDIIAVFGAPGSRPLLSYATNRYLRPAYRSDPPSVSVNTLAAVGQPAQLVLLAPNLGTIPDTTGRDDRYTAPPSHPQAYLNVRMRHSLGANFVLADGHVKWFRAPGNYRARSETGIVWMHCAGPRGVDDGGWFFPLSGERPATASEWR